MNASTTSRWHWTVYPAIVMIAILTALFVLQAVLRPHDAELIEDIRSTLD